MTGKKKTMVQFWRDVHTPKDFAGAVIVLFLATVAFTTIGAIIFKMITNWDEVSSASFGAIG